MNVVYTMGFDAQEREELIALLPPKYSQRVRLATGIVANPPPSIPFFGLSPETLPAKLDVGRRIRVKGHNGVAHTWEGRTGVIRDHYIDADDCSGTWGKAKYAISNDVPNHNFSISVLDVEFID